MLNQETHLEVAPKLLNDNNNINHDPLNDHNYCSPNKRFTNNSQHKSNEIEQSQQSANKIIPSNQNHISNSGSETQFEPSSSLSPNPSKSHGKSGPLTKNPQLISKSYSNENLSDSSSSSSSLSSSSNDSSKGLVIAQDSSVKASKSQSYASKDTPHISKQNKSKTNMTDCLQRTTGRVRAQRARQSTSVTDKSEWIMGDDQIDSVLSEHLDEDVRDRRHKSKSEHDSAYSLGMSSDYSSSDADSNQDSDCNSEDDPDRLWCVCRKPHEGKFMIRCDICLDWFHGHCVGVTKLMSDRFERQGKEWFCGECQEKLRSGMPRNAIPKKIVKKEKEKKKKMPIPGKRGRGRPRKSEMAVPSRVSLRTTRKSSSSLDPKTGVDNGRLRRNLARSDVRSDSFDEFEDSQRLKELIKERKKEFFYKRHLAEQQKAAKRNELGLGRPQLTANLGDSLDSLATSTSSSNLNNLPSNTKLEHRERSKLVLQINTKKDGGTDQNNSRIVTAIVRSPKKSKTSETLDPVVNDLFTAEPIQVNKKIKPESVSSIQTPSNQAPTCSNATSKPRKRSDSQSMVQKPDKGSTVTDQVDQSTPKKKRKNSESSNQNGSATPIGSKHIVQKIRDCLESRSKQIKDITVAEGKIDELAKDIEAQLNDCFKEGTQKYLNKFRSLLFNLRDVKNESLVKNVLSGQIAPERLVRMSPDEMASHELAEWRERENKHSIELIKRDAQLAAQQVIVKKTHKGEEVISAPTFTESEGPTADTEKEQPTTPVKQPPKETPSDGFAKITLTPPAALSNTPITPISSIQMKITNVSSESPLPIREEHSDESCWSGTISMPDIAKFSASAKPVSGSLDFMHDEIQEDLTVCGRIAPDQVQGYIKKLRTTTKNQILMIQLFPSSEDDKSNFNMFFDYLYSRNRYGVIQTNQQVLKDFYVLPIHENSNIPEAFKPIDGPGIDRSDPNCLLGLLIRNKRVTVPQDTMSLATYTPAPIN